jgi:hypothetical protein
MVSSRVRRRRRIYLNMNYVFHLALDDLVDISLYVGWELFHLVALKDFIYQPGGALCHGQRASLLPMGIGEAVHQLRIAALAAVLQGMGM